MKIPPNVPPSMISPEGKIVVSDENIDKLFEKIPTEEEVREAEARLAEFAKLCKEQAAEYEKNKKP
jgi:hypothetical protein